MAEDNAYDGSQYQFNPTPGPQQPQKYQQVGNRYRYYGELQGYTYNPYTDQYIPNKAGVTSVAEAAGYGPEKPKSAIDTYAPLIGGAAALGLGNALGKNPKETIGGGADLIKSGIDGVKGIFNMGGGPSTGAAPGSSPTSALPDAPGFFGNLFGGSSAGGAAELAMPSSEIGSTSFGGMSFPTMGLEAAPAPGAFNLGGIGTAGNAYLPAAGAFGAYKQITDPQDNPALGALQGAASGAAMGSYFGPPGAIVGGVAGGVIGLGTSLFGKDKDEWKREGNKLRNLQEEGTYIPENLIAGMPTKGRKLKDLVDKNQAPDFVGTDANGNWVNNKFANSRNVADLQPTDIVNYSAFAEHDPQWFNKPMEERLALADQALKANAVTEGKGTIKVDFSKLETPAQATATPNQPVAPTVQPKPVMKDPPRQMVNPVMPQQQAQAPQVQSTAAPRQGFGLRQSPGVYKDPNTGKVYNSVNGKLPGR